MKTCSKCNIEKALDGFYNRAASKDGKQHTCKVCNSAASARRAKKNKNEVASYMRSWRQAKKEILREKRKVYKKREKENKQARFLKYPALRLASNMRSSIWQCLKGITKNSHTLDYVSKTQEELMEYLESKFTEGMTRANYGEWHLDHIRPLASFDFTGDDKEEQLHKAWHYTNLQPLWAADNMTKGSKWEG